MKNVSHKTADKIETHILSL